MEKHVFKFGESSLAIIIPKKWAVKHRLSRESRISVSEGQRGELVISAEELKSREAARTVDKSLDPDLITRWIGLNYMYGASRLKIYSENGFSQEQLGAIEDKLSTDCPGFEVTSQSHGEIGIEDFSNIKDMDLQKVLARIKFLIEQEFTEVLSGNPKTVAKIEKRVNRFYMMGTRYLNLAQPRDYQRYYVFLNKLELISDRMAESSADVTPKKRQIYRLLGSQFALCYSAFDGDERLIAKAAELRKEVKSMVKRARLEHHEGFVFMEIANSIANIAEYGFMVEKALPV
ncbi:MAG: hypothetical protein LVQ95_03760 [Candidatus Micrarchaeales archaeon]|nr:hypothetical protein [Candidatus Micrarchaeales archaeon]